MPRRRSQSATPVASDARVFLVDDEPPVRRALTRLLRAAGLAAESFATATDVLAAITREVGPSCLVADLRMPGRSGLDLQDELQRRGIRIPIIFISGRADVGSGIRAMKGGAIDFLQKPVSDRVLLQAVDRALERDRRRRAADSERAELEGRAGKLTPREREVFALIVAGMLNKQVGAELGAAEKTIKVHRARVMAKMQAGSLADLVRMADRIGLSYGSIRRAGTAPALSP
jgi:FixJ family two-component response regulator